MMIKSKVRHQRRRRLMQPLINGLSWKRSMKSPSKRITLKKSLPQQGTTSQIGVKNGEGEMDTESVVQGWRQWQCNGDDRKEGSGTGVHMATESR